MLNKQLMEASETLQTKIARYKRESREHGESIHAISCQTLIDWTSAIVRIQSVAFTCFPVPIVSAVAVSADDHVIVCSPLHHVTHTLTLSLTASSLSIRPPVRLSSSQLQRRHVSAA